jgi:hypothetical protein
VLTADVADGVREALPAAPEPEAPEPEAEGLAEPEGVAEPEAAAEPDAVGEPDSVEEPDAQVGAVFTLMFAALHSCTANCVVAVPLVSQSQTRSLS